MVIEWLEEMLDCVNEETVIFKSPHFDKSIIGVDLKSNKAVYSISKMYEEFAEDNNMSLDDSIDQVEEMLDFMLLEDEETSPIVVDDTMFTAQKWVR